MAEIIQDKVTVILGAGASKEFGLPTGRELADGIVSLLSTREDDFSENFVDRELKSAVEYAVGLNVISGKQSLLSAAKLLRENLPIAPSIDNFLHTHRKNPDLVWLGKLSIVLSLLRSEAGSVLATDESNIRKKLDLKTAASTWIGQLFTQLIVAGDFESFIARLRKIYFVSFNYDRCVQQFFALASRQYFNLNDTQVRHVLKSLNIHYIYGNIGEFEYVGQLSSNFGLLRTVYRCIELIDKVQTFTEGRDAKDQETLTQFIDCAREVYFLGFGFNKLNLERIIPPEGYACNSLFATTLGQPEVAASQIREEMNLSFGKFLLDTNGARLRYDSAYSAFKSVQCKDLIWECHRNFQTAPD